MLQTVSLFMVCLMINKYCSIQFVLHHNYRYVVLFNFYHYGKHPCNCRVYTNVPIINSHFFISLNIEIMYNRFHSLGISTSLSIMWIKTPINDKPLSPPYFSGSIFMFSGSCYFYLCFVRIF